MSFRLTPELIKDKTYWANRRYLTHKRAVESFENDSSKRMRLLHKECRACFYLRNVMSGSAFTNFTCQNCDTVSSYPNTDVPRYCTKCSDEHNACVRCGGGLE